MIDLIADVMKGPVDKYQSAMQDAATAARCATASLTVSIITIPTFFKARIE
jgi:hypothetical protein